MKPAPLARPALSALPSVQVALRELARLMAQQLAEEDAGKAKSNE